MRRLRPMTRALAFGTLTFLLCPAPASSQLYDRPARDSETLRDVPGLADGLADRARLLAEEVDADLRRDRALRDDVGELALAADEFRRAVRGGLDRRELRRAYGGIAVTWQDLLRRLPRSGPVDRAAARVDELVGRLADALDVSPTRYGPALPGGVDDGLAEARRYARSLSDRADDLSAAIRAEMLGRPGGNRLARTASDLARASADYRRLAESADFRPDRLRDAFGPVAATADRLEADLSVASPTSGVRSAWGGFRPVLGLVRRQVDVALGPEAPAPAPPVPGFPDPPPPIRTIPGFTLPPLFGGPSAIPGTPMILPPRPGPQNRVVLRPVLPAPQVEERASILLEQVDMFLQAFVPDAGVVPEGEAFLGDASRLRDTIADFLAASQAGLDAGQLALRFREIDATYQRLARRTARIARGRSGPNIQQIGLIGQSVEALGANLAYPVDAGPYPLVR